MLARGMGRGIAVDVNIMYCIFQPLCSSEFFWSYNENSFWKFVNSSKGLYAVADSDQGKW